MRSQGPALAASLGRGLLAGLGAGLLLGIFHLLFSEPLIARALEFESGGPEAELFSRGGQQAGLVLAATLYGAALGGIFGLLWPVLARRLPSSTVWGSSLMLALIGFTTLWLIPFLKYPANPPAVGSPDTIGLRTAGYTGMVAISLAATALAWFTARRLSGWKPHSRQLATGAEYLAVIVAAYALLPGTPDPIRIPADLIWSFRLMSLAGQALLWLTLGVGFGLLTMRAVGKYGARSAYRVAEG